MRKAKWEVEIKLAVRNLPVLLAKLRQMGARPLECVRERNDLYDTPQRDFQRQSAILRIRTETPAPLPPTKRHATPPGGKTAEGGMLTYKGPVAGGNPQSTRYKVREEVEYHLARAKRTARILKRIGLRPWFRYEKYRTKFRLRGLPGLHIDVDETPLGAYVELEGPRGAIDRAARALGYGPNDYIVVSYLELFRAKSGRKGKKPRNMLFR